MRRHIHYYLVQKYFKSRLFSFNPFQCQFRAAGNLLLPQDWQVSQSQPSGRSDPGCSSFQYCLAPGKVQEMIADLGGPCLDLVELGRVMLQRQGEAQVDRPSQVAQEPPGLDIQLPGSPPLVGLLGSLCQGPRLGVGLGKLQVRAGSLPVEGSHHHLGCQSWQVQGSHHHLQQGSRCSGYCWPRDSVQLGGSVDSQLLDSCAGFAPPPFQSRLLSSCCRSQKSRLPSTLRRES